MTASIFHRGPDEGGRYLETGLVGLGIWRLRIIDLVKGGQPMFNEDQSIVVMIHPQ
jgi:asparagine synthase (glutamine-hydrolysing)